MIPDVALQGQYNYTFDRSGEGNTLPDGFITPLMAITALKILSLPIFQQNKQNINLQTAKITKSQLLVLYEQAKRNIERLVQDNAYETLNQFQICNCQKFRCISKKVLDLTQTPTPMVQSLSSN